MKITRFANQEAADAFLRGYVDLDQIMETYRPDDMTGFDRTKDLLRRGRLQEAVTSDDMPYLLAAGVNKMLLASYGSVIQNWKQCFRTRSVPDFKQLTIASLLEIETDDQAGNAALSGTIPMVPADHGFDEARLSDYHEVAQLSTYGVTFFITRKMIINDDLNGLQRLPELLGRAMARTITAKVINCLEEAQSTTVSGPLMADGVRAMASAATRLNLHSAALPLSAANVKAELILWQSQLTPNGKTCGVLGIRPKYLIVPAALELTAFEILSAAQLVGGGTTVSSQNILSFLTPIIIPELASAKDWYLAADPADCGGTIAVGYLQGRETPETWVRGEDLLPLAAADGQQYKIRHDFTAYVENWCGLRKIDDTT